jgi:hypothetical protein
MREPDWWIWRSAQVNKIRVKFPNGAPRLFPASMLVARRSVSKGTQDALQKRIESTTTPWRATPQPSPLQPSAAPLSGFARPKDQAEEHENRQRGARRYHPDRVPIVAHLQAGTRRRRRIAAR